MDPRFLFIGIGVKQCQALGVSLDVKSGEVLVPPELHEDGQLLPLLLLGDGFDVRGQRILEDLNCFPEDFVCLVEKPFAGSVLVPPTFSCPFGAKVRAIQLIEYISGEFTKILACTPWNRRVMLHTYYCVQIP